MTGITPTTPSTTGLVGFFPGPRHFASSRRRRFPSTSPSILTPAGRNGPSCGWKSCAGKACGSESTCSCLPRGQLKPNPFSWPCPCLGSSPDVTSSGRSPDRVATKPSPRCRSSWKTPSGEPFPARGPRCRSPADEAPAGVFGPGPPRAAPVIRRRTVQRRTVQVFGPDRPERPPGRRLPGKGGARVAPERRLR